MKEETVRRKSMQNESLNPFGSYSSQLDTEFHVDYFENEKGIKEKLQIFFIKDHRSSLKCRMFNLCIKLMLCILYVVRVEMEETQYHESKGCFTYGQGWGPCNDTNQTYDDPRVINWNFILWVHRDAPLYYTEVALSLLSLLQALLMLYLSAKGDVLHQILSWQFILEVMTCLPFVATLFSPEQLMSLFVPVFLHLWLAKSTLENIFKHDVHTIIIKTKSPLTQQFTVLIVTIITIFFTSACGFQHLQRGSQKVYTLFDSLWYVVVTFATVGYGDIAADIWPSRLFMMIMICLSLVVLPMQLEKLAFTWVERKKKGGSYSRYRAKTEKHVVVCATQLHLETILDFLNEFYAHQTLQDYYVVLLSSSDMQESLKIVLQIPTWSQRVIYIKGSALKDSDLQRCRMQDAEGCFLLASLSHSDRQIADQHTILRSWAVRDHSPSVKQYVQLYRPENKMHVRFAKVVVCEEEFKYALLAYNCLCPGTSTLVTLLLHTTRGQEVQAADEEWQKLYSKCSVNQIYEIKLCMSLFFRGYVGRSFNYASFDAHKRYGVCLIGIKQETTNGGRVHINPGPQYALQDSDTLFYLSITKEEQSCLVRNKERKFSTRKIISFNTPSQSVKSSGISHYDKNSNETLARNNSNLLKENPMKIVVVSPESTVTSFHQLTCSTIAEETNQNMVRVSIIPNNHSDSKQSTALKRFNENNPDFHVSDIIIDEPPVTPYVGKGVHRCHLLSKPRPRCCLQLGKSCKHRTYQQIKEYNWKNRAIIIATDITSNGLYNFILPLRSQCLEEKDLRPIVLLLSAEPERHFKEAIRHFPLVYWITGSIEKLDDWLKAGVNYADNLVVVNKEFSNSKEDDYLADCNTIIAVQTLFRLFPDANIITELSRSSNMRFMQFRADDSYALKISKLERDVRKKGSHMPYMFRLPFSAGKVFSASMLDTLLYQAFVKDYLISIVRILIGIDQEQGSGFLTCMHVTEQEMRYRTYGRLYRKLCSKDGTIPIGIYRTQATAECADIVIGDPETKVSDKEEIAQLVKGCMKSLNLSPNDYSYNMDSRKSQEFSYVIINPAFDVRLEERDIIYVLRPAGEVKSAAMNMSRTECASSNTSDSEEIFAEDGDDVTTLLSNQNDFYWDCYSNKYKEGANLV